MASFADVQYFNSAEMMGGPEKVQDYADVIYGRSLMAFCHFKILGEQYISHFSSPFKIPKVRLTVK